MVETIEKLAQKYDLCKKFVEEALKAADDNVKKAAETVDQDNITNKDVKLRENLYSYFSRKECNGIITTVREKGSRPGTCREAGIRSVKNIAEDLISRIKAVHLEPEEYITVSSLIPEQYLDTVWGSGDTVYDYIFNVDYGGNEGIYLDVYMRVGKGSDAETFSIITAKTLDESVEAFFKMSRLAAYCNILLRNDGYIIKGLTEYISKI